MRQDLFTRIMVRENKTKGNLLMVVPGRIVIQNYMYLYSVMYRYFATGD